MGLVHTKANGCQIPINTHCHMTSQLHVLYSFSAVKAGYTCGHALLSSVPKKMLHGLAMMLIHRGTDSPEEISKVRKNLSI